MNPDTIVATGVKDTGAADRHFASTLVDVAYATIIGDDSLRIEVEQDTNLRDDSDLQWIMGILRQAFNKIGEDSVNLAIDLETQLQNKAE